MKITYSDPTDFGGVVYNDGIKMLQGREEEGKG